MSTGFSIAGSVVDLASFLTGSLSNDGQDLFNDTITAIKDIVAEALTHDALRTLETNIKTFHTDFHTKAKAVSDAQKTKKQSEVDFAIDEFITTLNGALTSGSGKILDTVAQLRSLYDEELAWDKADFNIAVKDRALKALVLAFDQQLLGLKTLVSLRITKGGRSATGVDTAFSNYSTAINIDQDVTQPLASSDPTSPCTIYKMIQDYKERRVTSDSLELKDVSVSWGRQHCQLLDKLKPSSNPNAQGERLKCFVYQDDSENPYDPKPMMNHEKDLELQKVTIDFNDSILIVYLAL